MAEHLHFLGICGTFMGSLAVLAKQLGYRVTGSDANVYPPMSTQLESQGIEIIEGYDPAQLEPSPDCVIIGNAMSRGNPCVEAVLSTRLRYRSGPQWLSEALLSQRHVIALSGTHGKTTTATMVTHCLVALGLSPGYLIGGIPQGLSASAEVGQSDYFVIEADEYDTAFFDKRSKFIHYHPRTLVINNLEFDHADIFDDLAAIQRQFHHVIRTIAQQGCVIAPETPAIESVLKQGLWCEQQTLALANDADLQADIGSGWQARLLDSAGCEFEVFYEGELCGTVSWQLIGEHNVMNGLAAIAAVAHAVSAQLPQSQASSVSITVQQIIEALSQFAGVKRRLEVIAEHRGITVYDDFAHHPTAIETTLQGLRSKLGDKAKITAVIEPRSNTMKQGVHQQQLADCVNLASQVFWFEPEDLSWSLHQVVEAQSNPAWVINSVETLVDAVLAQASQGEHIVVMSNGGFGGFHQQLVEKLRCT